jgi:hypothetical protein
MTMNKHVSSLEVENMSIRRQRFIEPINSIRQQLSWRTSAWKRRRPDAPHYLQMPQTISFLHSFHSVFHYLILSLLLSIRQSILSSFMLLLFLTPPSLL